MKFPESPLAHALLDHLEGVEIGGSAHNPFNLQRCRNIDCTDDMTTVFKQGEIELCGEALPVDIVASGDDLPFADNELQYVISSHVIEHFFDPVAAIKEWLRVVAPRGIVFIIAPKSRALPGETRPPTHYTELVDRHNGLILPENVDMPDDNEHGHWSVWDLDDFLPLCTHYGWHVLATQETDDKVHNGFTVVLQK